MFNLKKTPFFYIDELKIYSPLISDYITFIEEKKHFAFVKRMHGIWDRFLDMLKIESCSSKNEKQKKIKEFENKWIYKHFYTDDFGSNLLNDFKFSFKEKNFIEAVSFKGYSKNSFFMNSHYKKNELISIFKKYNILIKPIFDAEIWKNSIITGEFKLFINSIKNKKIILVGPPHLSNLGNILNLNDFHHISIHPTEAIQDRHIILEKLLLFSDISDKVILFQAGAISHWLIYRTFKKLKNCFLLDIGRAIDIWFPQIVKTQNWFISNRDEIIKNMNIEHLYPKISFVDSKIPNYNFIKNELKESIKKNFWTNFAPVSKKLEKTIHETLELPKEKAVVVCNNGATALTALSNMYSFIKNKKMKWVVSSFTFCCQNQGVFSDSIIVDCNENGFLNIENLKIIPLNSYDGIIVTNIFGNAFNIEKYEKFAKENKKVLIFDSAACFYSKYKNEFLGNFGDAEFFSFHHTKPCGFGEGACVVIKKEFENIFRSIINFGLYKKINTDSLSMNGKMSDISASFILDYIKKATELKKIYTEQYLRICRISCLLGLHSLFRIDIQKTFPSNAPILLNNKVCEKTTNNSTVILKKYYFPLDNSPIANNIYEHIINFPCHSKIAEISDKDIRAIIQNIILRADNDNKNY